MLEDTDLLRYLCTRCDFALIARCITIAKNEGEICHGSKTSQDHLWPIDLDKLLCNPDSGVVALWSVRLDTNAEFGAFTHAVFGSPSIPNFVNEMKRGWFSNL